MSIISLDLKNLRLSCAKQNLRLFITPTLEVSDAAGMFDHLQLLEIFQALKSGCIWLSRGVGCKIKIRITFNGALLDSLVHEDAVEHLGPLIRDADLWNQLSLSPSLEIPCRQDARMDSDISINISHTQPPQNLAESALSIIPRDTKPPDGVPCLGLMKLELVLDFRSIRNSPVRRRKRKRLAEESMLLDLPHSRDDDQSLQLGNLQTGATAVFPSGSAQLYQADMMDASQEQTQGTPVSWESGEMENEDALLLDTDPAQLLTPPSSQPIPPEISNGPVGGSEVLEPAASTDLPVNFDLQVATILTDVGLRTLIGGRQIKATPGVKLLKPDQEHTLSDLAPSLWSPGYLKAVSQRSRFLPIISQTLSTPLLTHVQSPSLREKLSKLAELQASPLLTPVTEAPEGDDERPGSLSRKITRVLQARIWKMTQNGLRDPLAARRLQSILGSSDETRSRGGNADLLANAGELANFLCLAGDLAEFMREKHFEDFFDEEDDFEDFFDGDDDFDVFTLQGDLEHDSAESEELLGFQERVDRCDAEEAMHGASFGRLQVPDELIEIPEEFWEDLRFEEEGDSNGDKSLLIPEEFWEDIRKEEREELAMGLEDSLMLI